MPVHHNISVHKLHDDVTMHVHSHNKLVLDDAFVQIHRRTMMILIVLLLQRLQVIVVVLMFDCKLVRLVLLVRLLELLVDLVVVFVVEVVVDRYNDEYCLKISLRLFELHYRLHLLRRDLD